MLNWILITRNSSILLSSLIHYYYNYYNYYYILLQHLFESSGIWNLCIFKSLAEKMRPSPFFDFFNFISCIFGCYCEILKDWIKYNKTLHKCTLRIMFLKFCISNNIVPPHLNGFYNLKFIDLYHYGSKLMSIARKKDTPKFF